MSVESFIVSYAFETHRNGEKTSHFLSAGVKTDSPVSFDEFQLLQLQASYRVSVSTIHNALMRGSMTVNEANDRIGDLKNNYEAIRSKLEKDSNTGV